jgi:hypothetical protein
LIFKVKQGEFFSLKSLWNILKSVLEVKAEPGVVVHTLSPSYPED